MGSGHGAQADRARRSFDRRRTAVLRHQRVGSSRLRPRTPEALHDCRPWWFDGSRGGHAAAGRPRHVRLPLVRQQRASVDHGFVASAPEDKRLYTDGNPRPGVEIRLGPDGEIYSRGPDLCLGYTDPELTAKAFDDDGWYRTGDVGVLDEDGYLTITDRKADVIIRGGENISALEVEEVLLTMAAVAEAVVVSATDPRLGERAAAVLRVKAGHAMPTIEEVRDHFKRAGVATQKWPEQLHQVHDYPRTASGKVQKFLVRQYIA